MTDPGWKYGKVVQPVTTSVEGHEAAVSARMRDRVFWLLRRYTSLFYIERESFLLSKVIEGLKGEAGRASDPFEIRWFMNVLGGLYRYEASYEKGIALLQIGDPRGYPMIVEAAKASEYLQSRIFYDEDDNYRWMALGKPEDRPLVGILAWGRRAFTMMRNTLMTLRAEWTYDRFQEPSLAERDDVFPPQLAVAPFPAPGAPLCSSGDRVPIQGVWWPIDRRLGCPNYLLGHQEAPEAMSTVERQDYPGLPRANGLVYERRPSRWELTWADQRYSSGVTLDESEYESEDIEPPNEPLRLLPFP